MTDHAVLALEDGSVFLGRSIGADSGQAGDAASNGAGQDAGVAIGEVVFNTAMTGYQEILTDPSYARQLAEHSHDLNLPQCAPAQAKPCRSNGSSVGIARR